MSVSKEDEKFRRLVHTIDPQSRLIRTWELKGGVSAQVTALEIERSDGRPEKMIVRQHGAADLKQNPRVAADEWRLLRLLRSVGLATPMPLYLDVSGEIFSTPVIVLEYIEGKPELVPSDLDDCVLQLATHLFRIHSVDCTTLDLSFLPTQAKKLGKKLRERPINVDESLAEGRIRDILESVWPLPQQNRSVLLHGDFWPGNTLWQDGRLVAVIDWEDAERGDPLADVANSRLEILWAFGIDAMQSFTADYASMTNIDWANLPYWDLCAALRPASRIAEWAGNDVIEQTMRAGHRVFITQAFDKLSIR